MAKQHLIFELKPIDHKTEICRRSSRGCMHKVHELEPIKRLANTCSPSLELILFTLCVLQVPRIHNDQEIITSYVKITSLFGYLEMISKHVLGLIKYKFASKWFWKTEQGLFPPSLALCGEYLPTPPAKYLARIAAVYLKGRKPS